MLSLSLTSSSCSLVLDLYNFAFLIFDYEIILMQDKIEFDDMFKTKVAADSSWEWRDIQFAVNGWFNTVLAQLGPNGTIFQGDQLKYLHWI